MKRFLSAWKADILGLCGINVYVKSQLENLDYKLKFCPYFSFYYYYNLISSLLMIRWWWQPCTRCLYLLVHAMLHPFSSPLPALTLSLALIITHPGHISPSWTPLTSTFPRFYLLSPTLIVLSKCDSYLKGKKKKKTSLVSLQPSLLGRVEYTSSLFIQTCLSVGFISCLLHFFSPPHALTDI